MLGNVRDKSFPPTFTISIVKEAAVLLGYSFVGLFINLGRKAIIGGIPKAMLLGYWLKKQIIFIVRKSDEVGKPKVIEVGQITRGLLILAVRNLKARGEPKTKRIGQLITELSYLSYKKAKKVVGDRVNAISQDIMVGKIKASAIASLPPSPEIILKDEEAINLNERLAQEIIQNGIECKAITEIGSLTIERKPCYSYLFAMSPRIITNRGCIRLERKGTRNIDFVQIVQKN